VHPTLRKAILPVGLLVGLGFFALAGVFGRTDDGVVEEEGLEAVQPVNTAEAQPRQISVVADLAPGYDGVLRIDDLEIPADQLELDEGLNKLIFRPGDDKVLTRFQPGTVDVSVTYWPLEEGRTSSRVYRWSFKVV
jgi:hypothetical protein